MAKKIQGKRFTIYDRMAEEGAFASNPANVDCDPELAGTAYTRADYPKMLFHPQGEERIIVSGEDIMTPFGPKHVGQQRELIWQTVATPAEEKRLRADGWHLTPHAALAIAAQADDTRQVPPASPVQVMDTQAARIAQLEAQLAALGGGAVASPDLLDEVDALLTPKPKRTASATA